VTTTELGEVSINKYKSSQLGTVKINVCNKSLCLLNYLFNLSQALSCT